MYCITCSASYPHPQPGGQGSRFGFVPLKPDCSKVTCQRTKWQSLEAKGKDPHFRLSHKTIFLLYMWLYLIWRMSPFSLRHCTHSRQEFHSWDGAECSLSNGVSIKVVTEFLALGAAPRQSKDSRCLSKEMSWQQPLWHSLSGLQHASGVVITTFLLLLLVSTPAPKILQLWLS